MRVGKRVLSLKWSNSALISVLFNSVSVEKKIADSGNPSDSNAKFPFWGQF